MKFIKITAIVVGVLILGAMLLAWFNSRPISAEQAAETIQKTVESNIGEKLSVSAALVYVDAPQKDFSMQVAAGTREGDAISSSTPFHAASVGKLFTATLIGRLVDEGQLALDDPIDQYLDDATLEQLFVFEGVDYKDQVTVQHLLSHTSGIADYFSAEDNGIASELYNSPDTMYTPDSLLTYTREHQSAHFAPGEGFHYSDSGYILLGLLIESISGETFDHMLHDIIFDPLGMHDSYLMFCSEPVNGLQPIQEAWVDGHEVTHNNSVSMDWAGGGVVSTLDDLAVFIRALHQGEIIKMQTLQSMQQFDQEFMRGIAYGSGFMQMQFEKFLPTLGFLPRMTGHMGVLGNVVFYDLETDLVYIASYGSSDAAPASIKDMITILSTVHRIDTEN